MMMDGGGNRRAVCTDRNMQDDNDQEDRETKCKYNHQANKKENTKQTSSVPRTLVALPPNLCQATVPRQGLETLAPASAGII